MGDLFKRVLLVGSLWSMSAFAADYRLIVQSLDPADESIYKMQQEWFKGVEKESNGRLVVDLYPVEGIVNHTETLDAMRLGLLDGHISTGGYFSDKEVALGLAANTVGAWSNVDDFLKYLYEGGGNQLMEELYKPFGVQYVGGFARGNEAFVSKIPLKGVDDLKKLTMRSPGGMVTKVFEAAGANPVAIPSTQIVSALEKDVINAADYSVFAVNQDKGLNTVAPNPVYPGFHSLPLIEFSINQQKWDDLPNDLQELLKKSVREFAEKVKVEMDRRDMIAVEAAQKDPNIKIHDWSKEERKKFRQIASEQWKIAAQQSAAAQNVYKTVTKFLKDNGLL